MCTSHFHSFRGVSVFPRAQNRVQGPHVVEHAGHLVVKVAKGVQGAAVHVVPKMVNILVKICQKGENDVTKI